ncbi:MAG: hypothetical protein K2I49_03005, partial [Ureaplasma sp.]|nr:hypothetical protein [Ureaplasma sp.]
MNKKLLIGLLTTIPTIGIAATTTVLTSCKSNSNESTTQDSNSESSSNLDFKDGNSITEDIIEKDNNANNIIESKLDIGMLYYKNLMINSDRQDTINFNPLSKYDYETFKETAYTNATQKLSTNDSDKYNNFRLKLY